MNTAVDSFNVGNLLSVQYTEQCNSVQLSIHRCYVLLGRYWLFNYRLVWLLGTLIYTTCYSLPLGNRHCYALPGIGLCYLIIGRVLRYNM